MDLKKVNNRDHQDGSYLAEFLVKKGYEVHGLKRPTSLLSTDRIDHLYREPQELDSPLISIMAISRTRLAF